MDLTSGFLGSSLGTVTVSTPFSMDALICSGLVFSGRRNLRRNLPLLRSTRCHLSDFSSCSLLRSPLICRMLPSSTSTLTSSFFSPGTSALNTCTSGVSFQSMRAPAKAAASELARGKRLPLLLLLPPEPKGKPSTGSQRSREKGSNALPRRISDMVDGFGREGRLCL
ncbi:Os03g0267100 [Oryza sativa Japonica Group]|uniref:Os03g0267100 protein n=2 Tax=Oryza sativa subsp. japonica TaxID=39947 RepID=Q0DT61_ORYSJ|nr:hypothetical protein EE612_016680 [Oryza sativa]BAF11577.1 Os03g0267100 [Oryza sativa Japonica Group]BAS83423.1 Os03g0267100 [Oryza sativa Japonica Group]|eukprot:NP_001049663.1 Os03g0267100 [Oryza sativa Japonica Group]